MFPESKLREHCIMRMVTSNIYSLRESVAHDQESQLRIITESYSRITERVIRA